MSRSKWKGAYAQSELIKIKKKSRSIKIWSRDSTITPAFLRKRVLVYNGKSFRPVIITSTKLGYKFGEFIFTRKFVPKVTKKSSTKSTIKKK
jgi:small subunit ribosomal protein S19